MQEKVFTGAVLIVTVLLCIGMPKISNKLKPDTPFTQEFATGIVEEVLEEDLSPDPVVQGRFRGTQKLRVKILEGTYQNKEFEVYNTLSSLHSNLAYKGLKAVFTLRESGGQTAVWLYNLKRDTHVFVLAALFFAALVMLGRGQGLKSALGLVFTCVLIVTVLIPALFAGFPPVPVSIVLVSLMTVVSFILISGFTRKTFAAIAGTVSGITIAGIISAIVSYFAQLSGVNMEGGEQLLNLAPDYNLQLDGLLFTSILIASLGAVMDVSMSIASSMQEILTANPRLTKRELFKSGLTVGKDITGTMSNTLILAFAGSSLPLVMMIWGYGMSFKQFINIPRIVIEIMHGISGSIGIIAAVPCTALVALFILKIPAAKKVRK
ncbi:YibE/F family protein [Treponema vincentii]|uniref:YibE/F family protein n=1 Tax=Treponema vincentii TaxID=69710 RepID=UPI0020A4A5DA|nr:YibE/F family protein [Treponema vincentii]UTC47066.1 YibE/F family protein [Treponema vincentii]UTC49455.1 YibE/F family protein [Treponema vincentii]